MVLAAEFGSGQVLWSVLWIFLFMLWFWLLIAIFGDLFRDKDLSGGMKAFWCLFVIVLPYLGIFVYLIVRGHGMSERAVAAAKAQQAELDAYVRKTAGAVAPADQIAQAKSLLDQGVITADEFEKLKQQALS